MNFAQECYLTILDAVRSYLKHSTKGKIFRVREHQRKNPTRRIVFNPVKRVWQAQDRGKLGAHITGLRIPPAWQNVFASDDPNADLLVTGVDAAGRRQAIYSKKFLESNSRAKFARIQELDTKFNEILNAVNKAVKSGIEEAYVLRLVMQTGVRPGSTKDTKAVKKAFGATTLESQHVVSDSKGVFLKFIGKKGVENNLRITDKGLASDLLARAKKGGRLFNTDAVKLSAFTHSLDGGGFKTKDFRTLLATRTAQEAVRSMAKPVNGKQYKSQVRSVAKLVASKLGNTPTVALQSYIHPAVFAEWRTHA